MKGILTVYLFFFLAGISMAQEVQTVRTVTIDLSKEYQEIDNFGASDCWSMQKIGAWSEENKTLIADLLFSKEKGIGLTCWRFNLGGGVNRERIPHPWRTVETFEVAEGQYDWTRQANERWFLRAAKERGVPCFVAFVNSPPSRMTRSGFTNCEDDGASTNLKPGYEGQYARYLADILKHFRDNPDESERIAFDWISPVNEPQWEWIRKWQEGCRYSNDDIKAVMKALGEELKAAGLQTGILVPESGNMGDMWKEREWLGKKYGEKYGDYLAEFCSDPEVNSMMGNVICGHSYGNDLIGRALVPMREKLRESLSKYPDWKHWQTEYCVMQGPYNKGGNGRDLGITTALNVARVIHCDLAIGNNSAWHWWTAVSREDYKDGLVYTDHRNPEDPESVIPSKTLWALGHYSRFIRPGARRVGLKGADDIEGLLGSAYLHPETGQLTVVLLNCSESDISVSMSLQGTESSDRMLTPYVTSDTAGEDMKHTKPVSIGTPFNMKAKSIVSMVAVP